MMRVSVFTPSHQALWLDDCWKSLQSQTYDDWEWIVVLNDGARWSAPDDPRVKVLQVDQLHGVGACKSYACAQATGEILLELDHDDYLLPTAIADVVDAARANPRASLIYSQFAQVDRDLQEMEPPFDVNYGWTYQHVIVNIDGEERKVLQTDAMDGSYPHNAGLIWYAPNHLRAFPRWAYDRSGGYDWHRTVLDDQDLMSRLYMLGDFVLIDKCLYLQRWHPFNTQAHQNTNEFIQTNTVEQYVESIQNMALAWTARRGLRAIDLGAAHGKPSGYYGIDLHDGPDVDHVGDAIEVLESMEPGSAGLVRAVDFLEHVPDRIRLFNAIHRVLAHGGMLLSLTPSSDGRGAYQDPTHVSYYNENAFWYFTQQEFAAYVPEITARFQISRLATLYPTQWHAEHDIPYVSAHLIALKPGGPRMGGLCYWPD